MSIIKSIKQTDFTVIITTKSNVVRVYKFDTIKECNEYYNDITSWQYDCDKMSMTKSHGGILVNVFYQLNESTTFIQTKYER